MEIKQLITLTKVPDVDSGFIIVSNADRVSRFITGEGFSLSHETLKFTLYETPYAANSEPVTFSRYQLGYLDAQERFCEFTNYKNYISTGSDNHINDDGSIVVQQEKTLFFDFQDYINKEEDGKLFHQDDLFLLLVFRYIKDDGEVLAQKVISIENGVSSSMAKFNVTASNINAAVDDAGLIFNAAGLEINNGDFTIKEGGTQVFGFETQNIGGQEVSRLALRGMIYADGGEFSGRLRATSGEIGGFQIDSEKLVSIGKDGENPAIELNGTTGIITAHKINLGDGAVILNQIQLGDAYLYNPENHDGKIIESGKIAIKDNGTANFGGINIDGQNSEIIGANWKIGNDYASFSNVNVSGAIENVIFRTNSVQAAGGTMIFRPSYKGSLVESEEGFVVVLENTFEGVVGDYVQIVPEGETIGYFGTVTDSNENRLDISWSEGTTIQKAESIVLVNYGGSEIVRVGHNYPISGYEYYRDEEGKNRIENIEESYSQFASENEYLTSNDLAVEDGCLITQNKFVVSDGVLINSIQNLYTRQEDVIIGINAGRTKAGAYGAIYPRGLTLTSLSDAQNSVNPKLYLGDLKEVGLSGYGLYANNVYLKGSLTTEINKDNYAGVNTLNGADAIAFKESFEKRRVDTDIDTSKIVFWAGSEDTSNEAIQKALFQVTEKGSLYAQRAKLEDSLMVGGVIKAAEIHTAELHGRDGSLSIYDDSQGIQFKKQDGENIFSIGASGLVAGNKGFINISTEDSEGSKISFVGNELRTAETNHLTLKTLVDVTGFVPVLQHVGKSNNTCGFYFEEGSTNFKTNKDIIQSWTSAGAQVNNTFKIAAKGYSLQYKQEEKGYNLYVIMS